VTDRRTVRQRRLDELREAQRDHVRFFREYGPDLAVEFDVPLPDDNVRLEMLELKLRELAMQQQTDGVVAFAVEAATNLPATLALEQLRPLTASESNVGSLREAHDELHALLESEGGYLAPSRIDRDLGKVMLYVALLELAERTYLHSLGT
jgi:hypothetical protein